MPAVSLRSPGWLWVLIMLGVLALAISGCSASDIETGSSAEAFEAESDGPQGPCLDESANQIGESELIASVGDQVVLASFGSSTVRYCPGSNNPGQGPVEGDGFFWDLDEAILEVSPGETVTVVVHGLRKHSFSASVEVASDEAQDDGSHTYELIAPTEPGEYTVDLKTSWAEGRQHHRIVLAVEP